MKSNKKCQQLLETIEQSFFKVFKNKRIAQREWQSVQETFERDPLGARNVELIIKRIKNKLKIAQGVWKDPAHVVFRAAGLCQLKDMDDAMAMFATSQKFYEKKLRKYICGNLAINCEISYDQNEDKSLTYNIHAHVLCEKAAYLTAKENTKHWRQGSNQKEHYISSRLCDKKYKQTPQEYVDSVFMYNSKWTVNQGDSRVKVSGKRSLIHKISHKTIEYAHQKTDCFIRISKKKANKTAKETKKLLADLNQLKKHYKSWLLLAFAEKHQTILAEHINIPDKIRKKLPKRDQKLLAPAPTPSTGRTNRHFRNTS